MTQEEFYRRCREISESDDKTDHYITILLSSCEYDTFVRLMKIMRPVAQMRLDQRADAKGTPGGDGGSSSDGGEGGAKGEGAAAGAKSGGDDYSAGAKGGDSPRSEGGGSPRGGTGAGSKGGDSPRGAK